jgi:hypothetical protein
MARRKHSMRDFERAAIKPTEQKKIKGGRKASPVGPGYQGSFIWEGIDIRSSLFFKKVEGISSSSLSNF